MIQCKGCDKLYLTKSEYKSHLERPPSCNKSRFRESRDSRESLDHIDMFKTMVALIEKRDKELDEKLRIIDDMKEELGMIGSLKGELESVKEELDEIKAKLEETEIKLAKTPRIRNKKKNIFKLAPLSNLKEETIRSVFKEKLTKTTLSLLKKGVASIIGELNDAGDGRRYIVCADASRRTFVIQDDAGKEMKDPYARIFMERIKEPLLERIEELIQTEFNPLSDIAILPDIHSMVIRLRLKHDVFASEFSKKFICTI